MGVREASMVSTHLLTRQLQHLPPKPQEQAQRRRCEPPLAALRSLHSMCLSSLAQQQPILMGTI
jgi:hypothetical protein